MTTIDARKALEAIAILTQTEILTTRQAAAARAKIRAEASNMVELCSSREDLQRDWNEVYKAC